MRRWRLPKPSDFRWLLNRPPARERRRRTGWTICQRCAAGSRRFLRTFPRGLGGVPPGMDTAGLLEEFLVGDEHTFDSVTVGGETVFSSISDYQPTPLEVLRQPWIQDRRLAPGAERPAV